jgi:transcriptional regulator with XRE-family HTH domain
MDKRVFFRKDRIIGKYSHYVNDLTIRAEMARNRYNYTDMAKLMGLHPSTYQAFINGKIEPTAGRMVQISEILNLPVSELFKLNTNN